MIFIFILAAVFILDYRVKAYVETHKKEGKTELALGGFIKIRRLSNHGIAGGRLSGNPKVVKCSSGILTLVMGIHFLKELFQKGNHAVKLCYSVILGGALSNFYDRVKKGAVTDYFSFCVPVRKIRKLVFNISDLFIIFGSMILFLLQIRRINQK